MVFTFLSCAVLPRVCPAYIWVYERVRDMEALVKKDGKSL